MKKNPILLLASLLALSILVIGIVSNATADMTAPLISGITVSDITETSVTISWTTDELATSNIAYGPDGLHAGLSSPAVRVTMDTTADKTSHNVNLSDLSSGTPYLFYVRSKDAAGNEAISDQQTFTTIDTTAPVISGITVSVTETTATISWATDEPATSTIDFNQCIHTMGCITASISMIGDTADKTSHSVTISGRSPGTTTNFQVISKDASGNVAASSWLNFTTSNLPGTGNISGRLIHTSGGSSFNECVYIFKHGETSNYDSMPVYYDGYYVFRNVPAGQYEIYTSASYCPITGFTGDPSAVIAVFEGEETQVDTLTQIGSLSIRIGEPEAILVLDLLGDGCYCCHKNIVEEPNPTFYWWKITNAAYYTVEIWSIYTNEHPQNKEYDETVTVTATEIEWPTDLSTLIYNEFRVDVRAYTADGSVIASNYRLFCVDQCDGE